MNPHESNVTVVQTTIFHIKSFTVMAMAISYNWLFLWAKKHFILMGFSIRTYNWYNSGPVTANPFNPDVCW